MLEIREACLQNCDSLLENFCATPLVFIRVFAIAFTAVSSALTANRTGAIAFLDDQVNREDEVGRTSLLICAFDS